MSPMCQLEPVHQIRWQSDCMARRSASLLSISRRLIMASLVRSRFGVPTLHCADPDCGGERGVHSDLTASCTQAYIVLVYTANSQPVFTPRGGRDVIPPTAV